MPGGIALKGRGLTTSMAKSDFRVVHPQNHHVLLESYHKPHNLFQRSIKLADGDLHALYVRLVSD